MEESITEIFYGADIASKEKAVDKVIEEIQEKYTEYFKSQPPIFEEDGYLILSKALTRTYFNTANQFSILRRDVEMGTIVTLPDYIWKDLTQGISSTLDALNKNITKSS